MSIVQYLQCIVETVVCRKYKDRLQYGPNCLRVFESGRSVPFRMWTEDNIPDYMNGLIMSDFIIFMFIYWVSEENQISVKLDESEFYVCNCVYFCH